MALETATPTRITNNLTSPIEHSGGNGTKEKLDDAPRSSTDDQPVFSQAPSYVSEVLDEAERLIKYASESGVPIAPEVRTCVVLARLIGPNAMTAKGTEDLLEAYTMLAGRLKPITAESLKVSRNRT